MSRRSNKAIAEADRKPNTLAFRREPGETAADGNALIVVAGLASNSVAQCEWSAYLLRDDVDVTACLNAAVDMAARVNRGDLGDLEAMLTTQAITLNAVFTQCAIRAKNNLGEHLDAADRYLRLALKAQGQCRATVETLAMIKNPPTVFARQANIAHGPQQVNNGNSPTNRDNQQSSRVGNQEIEPDELLEAPGERMDGGTADAASQCDPELASMGAIDGPRTVEGKARAARNADRGGQRGLERDLSRRVRAALHAHHEALAARGASKRMRIDTGDLVY